MAAERIADCAPAGGGAAEGEAAGAEDWLGAEGARVPMRYGHSQTAILAPMSPGELIRTARKRHGLSQARLALRAGTTQSAISRLERGERSPSIETLERLLLVMGERLELSTKPQEHQYDPIHLAAARRLSPAERLRRGFDWIEFAGEMRAAGERARRAQRVARTG